MMGNVAGRVVGLNALDKIRAVRLDDVEVSDVE